MMFLHLFLQGFHIFFFPMKIILYLDMAAVIRRRAAKSGTLTQCWFAGFSAVQIYVFEVGFVCFIMAEYRI